MKKSIKILSGLLTVAVVLSAIVWQSNQTQDLKVYFFDVGQGDAILIRTPSHQNIIIDGGPDNSLIAKLGQVLPFYDRTIDLMILTHPHDDHIFGLVEVLKRYQVKQVLSSGVLHSTDVYLEWLKIIRDQNIPLKIALAGQRFIFAGTEVKVIYPFQNFFNQRVENLNSSSVVVQLVYRDSKIIFMADLEIAGEREIIQKVEDLQTAVIKIGHHGSSNASSEEFLKKISPNYAIIQVGKDNKFNHPSPRIISRLERLGCAVLRTDDRGDILLKSHGGAMLLTNQ